MERILTNNLTTEVYLKRQEISEAIRHPQDNLISIIGPCPMVDEPQIILKEASVKTDLENEHDKLTVLDRQCFTKPRTNPADWQGLDSSNPEAVQEIISNLSDSYGNAAAEIRFERNLVNYANYLSFIWTGARNISDNNIINLIAMHDPTLPIGIKNGLDGEIEQALEHVQYINDIRPKGSAPAVLIYRGGENAMNSAASADMYKRAHDATDGRIIRDNAHGVEMAHHPDGNFKKSIEGQIIASAATIELAKQGFAPLGVMYEASELESIMDPHMPLETAIKHTELMYAARFGSIVTSNEISYKNLPHHGFGGKKILA